MKTVITEKIDGHEVVVGIDVPIPDPVETQKVVNDLMDESDLIKQKKAHQEEFNELVKKINAKKSLFAEGKGTEKTFNEIKTLEAECDQIIKSLEALFPDIQKHYKKLYRENLVYFVPKPGEEIIADEEADELIKALQEKEPDEVVTKDKKKIKDQRKKSLWKKENNEWTEFRVGKLGQKIPAGFTDLNELHGQDKAEIIEQVDINRVHGMPQHKREDEFEYLENDLKTKLPLKVIEYELEGDTHKDALDKANKWFDDEKKKLKKKYLLDE